MTTYTVTLIPVCSAPSATDKIVYVGTDRETAEAFASIYAGSIQVA